MKPLLSPERVTASSAAGIAVHPRQRHPVAVTGALLLHVGLPVVAGGMIYVLWRSPSLAVFEWIRAVGLEGVIAGWRARTAAAGTLLPAPLLFSAPDGLWAYGLMAGLRIVWSGTRARTAHAWYALALAAAMLPEVAQRVGLVPGTFDFWDLFASAAGALAGWHAGRRLLASPSPPR